MPRIGFQDRSLRARRRKRAFSERTIQAWGIALRLAVILVCATAGYSAWDLHKTQVELQSSLKDVPVVVTGTSKLLATGTVTLKQVGDTTSAFGAQAGAAGTAIAKFGNMADGLNAVATNMQRPCNVYNVRTSPFYTPFFTEGSFMPCGFLPDVTQTLNTTRNTIGTFNLIGVHVSKNLPLYDKQEADLYTSAFTNMNAFTAWMQSSENQKTTADIRSILSHFSGMSASSDSMLSDFQWKEHQLLHPDKVKLTFWGGTFAGLQALHKLSPPLF